MGGREGGRSDRKNIYARDANVGHSELETSKETEEETTCIRGNEMKGGDNDICRQVQRLLPLLAAALFASLCVITLQINQSCLPPSCQDSRRTEAFLHAGL